MESKQPDTVHLAAPGTEPVHGQTGRGASARRAEHVLADHGVFAGHTGLRGLVDAQEFWDGQPYGTRLYYGPGMLDYLHRGVLRTAIEVLDEIALAASSDSKGEV